VQKSKGTHTAFSNQFEISVFVSLALVLQAANMYLLFVGGKKKKATDKDGL